MCRERGVVKTPRRMDSFPRYLKGRHEQHLSQRGRWIHSCVIAVNTKEVTQKEMEIARWHKGLSELQGRVSRGHKTGAYSGVRRKVRTFDERREKGSHDSRESKRVRREG